MTAQEPHGPVICDEDKLTRRSMLAPVKYQVRKSSYNPVFRHVLPIRYAAVFAGAVGSIEIVRLHWRLLHASMVIVQSEIHCMQIRQRTVAAIFINNIPAGIADNDAVTVLQPHGASICSDAQRMHAKPLVIGLQKARLKEYRLYPEAGSDLDLDQSRLWSRML
jgi:hypothetical protein